MAVKTVKTIVVRLTADAKNFRREMGRAVQFMDASAAKMRQAGQAMTLGVTLPIVAAGGAAVKFAADAQEMESKLSVVFGKNSKDVRAWSNTYAKAVNRGTTETRRMVGDAGDLLKGMGLAEDGVLEMSKAMVALTDDLSSFKNVEGEQAFIALRGAVTGEFEALKTLGVVIKAADRDTRALTIAQAEGTDVITNRHRTMAAMALVMERTSDAQGDAARTSQSLTNKLRGMTGRMHDAAVSMGNKLIPVTEDLVGWVIKLLDNLGKLDPQVVKWGLVSLGAAAALGPLLWVMGSLVGVAAKLGGAVALLATPMGLFTATVAAGLIIITAWRREIVSMFNGAADDITQAYDQIGLKTKGFWDQLNELSRLALGDLGAGIANKFEQIAQVTEWMVRAIILGLATAGQAMAKFAGFDYMSPQLERLKKLDAEGWGSGFWTELFNPDEAQEAADILMDNAITPTMDRIKADWTALSAYVKGLVMGMPGMEPGSGPSTPGGGGSGEGGGGAGGGGAGSFMKSIEDQAKNVSKFGDMAADSVGGIGDSFVDAALAGESFGEVMKEMFKDLLVQIMKAIMQQMILNAVMGLARAFGPGEFGVAGGQIGPALPPGFHSGGRITGPSVVGERGAEIFSPDRAGHVTSASSIAAALAGGGGGGGAVVNVNVQNNAQGTEASVDATDPSNIKVFIETTAAESISRGGPVWKAFQARSGARSRTVQR